MAKKYACRNCGAELYFDPKRGKLHCEYCGSDFDPSEYDMTPEEAAKEDRTVPQEAAEGTGEEAAEAAAAAGDQAATDDSVSTDDLVVYECPNCGAEIITSKKTVATTCIYCNKAITLTGHLRGEFHPDYVLPFRKTRDDAIAAYKKLAKQSVLTPKLFTKESTVEKIKGMYVPYWLYSFRGEGGVKVSATRVRTWREGDDEVTETSNFDVFVDGNADFSRIPADGMKEMDNAMMDSIEPFDFSKLVPFNPAYLTGFYTQRWDENADTNEPRAKSRAKEAFSGQMLSHTGAYTTRVITGEHYDWTDQKVEQVMIPVWMMYTEYRGKKYVFGMNGQTGKMMGKIPQDPARFAEIAAGVFVISQIVMMILRILGVTA